MPTDDIEKRDLIKVECNLEEFPYFRLSKKQSKSQREFMYEREITDKNGLKIIQRWTVRGSGDLGLPGGFEQDVLKCFEKLYYEQGMPEDGKIHFTKYKIIELLGLEHTGENYQRLGRALKRLASTSIESENAFYKRDTEEYVTDVFSIFSNVYLYERFKKNRENKNKQGELEFSYVTLNERIRDSYKAKYIKFLSFNNFMSLDTPLAKRVYVYVDKKRAGRLKYEEGLVKFAAAIPVYQNDSYGIRRTLQPAFKELIDKRCVTYADFEKTADGKNWKVVFVFHGDCKPSQQATIENPEPIINLQEFPLFVNLNPIFLKEVCESFGRNKVENTLDILQWQYSSSKGKIKNPEGLLYNSLISPNLQPPRDYITVEERIKSKEKQEKQREEAEKRMTEQKAALAAEEAMKIRSDEIFSEMPLADRQALLQRAEQEAREQYHSLINGEVPQLLLDLKLREIIRKEYLKEQIQ